MCACRALSASPVPPQTSIASTMLTFGFVYQQTGHPHPVADRRHRHPGGQDPVRASAPLHSLEHRSPPRQRRRQKEPGLIGLQFVASPSHPVLRPTGHGPGLGSSRGSFLSGLFLYTFRRPPCPLFGRSGLLDRFHGVRLGQQAVVCPRRYPSGESLLHCRTLKYILGRVQCRQDRPRFRDYSDIYHTNFYNAPIHPTAWLDTLTCMRHKM